MKALVFLALACAASSVQAATMLVDFGVASFTTPGWNNFTSATNGSSLALVDTGAGATPYTITLGGGDVNVLNDDPAPVAPTSPAAPFTPFTVTRDGFFQTGVRTLTLSGLSSAETYNITLYSYVNRDTTRATRFTIGGAPITIEPARFPTDGSNVSGQTATFNGLVPDGSGNIVITVASAAGTNWILNGMQIVSVPEPAAALIGGLGLIPLLRRRRTA